MTFCSRENYQCLDGSVTLTPDEVSRVIGNHTSLPNTRFFALAGKTDVPRENPRFGEELMKSADPHLSWPLQTKLVELGTKYDVWVRHLRTGRPGILRTNDDCYEDHSLCTPGFEHSQCQVVVDFDTGHGRFSRQICRISELTVCTPTKKMEFVTRAIGKDDEIGTLKLVCSLPPARGQVRRIGISDEGSRTPREELASLYTKISKKLLL